MGHIEHTRKHEASKSLFSARDQAYSSDAAQFSDFISTLPESRFLEQTIKEKSRHFQQNLRQLLTKVLREQLDHLDVKAKPVLASLSALEADNTFLIVTAHQPCLFTGPLYFIYKIASTIALARQANALLPDHTIIPLYVIGSEDHDFEEINHVNLFHNRIEWDSQQSGAVGRMKLNDIDAVIDKVEQLLGNDAFSNILIEQLQASYHDKYTLAQATAHFVYSLFGQYGLIVADLYDSRLKQIAVPLFESEISNQIAKPFVDKNHAALNEMGFGSQIFPREINLFYFNESGRHRIIRDQENFNIGGEILSKETLLELLREHTERFSPNVVLRALVQQMILPGIAYIGGGAEVSYWMEINALFNQLHVPFPMLVRRDSAIWIKPHTTKLMSKVHVTVDDLFRGLHTAQERYLRHHQGEDWTMDKIRSEFEGVFENLFNEIEQIDHGLVKMAKGFQGQEKNFIDKLEVKLKKSIKSQHETAMNQIQKIWKDIFPNDGLQERNNNFMEIYNRLGPAFIDALVNHFDPLNSGMHTFMEDVR